MSNDVDPRKMFHPNTGAPGYDGLRFSGKSVASVVSSAKHQVEVIRHLGINCAGQSHAWASGHQPQLDLVTVNLNSPGTAYLRCGDFRGESPIHRGHVSFLPGLYHVESEFPASHSALGLILPAARLNEAFGDLKGSEPQPFVNQRNERLAQLITMLEGELLSPGFSSDLLVDGLVRAIQTMLVRYDTQPEIAERIHLTPARLKRVTDFVESHLDQNVTLGDLAAVAGLSPFHFSRVFKLATSETPYHFLGARRINRARELLMSTDMPLAELALTCGFASQSHFTAAFTKATGTSPGRFRKLHAR